MKKLILLFLLLIASGVNSETLFEEDLSTLGIQDISVTQQEKSNCYEFTHVIGLEEKEINDNLFVFSLHGEFEPVKTENAFIRITVNDLDEVSFNALEFNCDDSCYKRVVLRGSDIKKENLIKACVESGNSTAVVRLLNDSTIGIYKMPFFEKKDFVKSVNISKPEAGSSIEVSISILNSGTEEANVKIAHVSDYVDLIKRRKEVKEIGNTNFEAVILPGEKKVFGYKLLIKQPTQMTLPGAIMEFENVFGETETLRSNEKTIYAVTPTIVAHSIIGIEEVNQNTVRGKVVVSNPSEDRIFQDMEVSIIIDGVELENFLIDELNSGDSEEQEFSTIVSQGSHELTCRIEFQGVTEECNTASFETKKAFDEILLTAGIIFFLLSAIIYLTIKFRKFKK